MIPFVTAGGMRIDYLITHTGEARVNRLGGNALYAAVGAATWQAKVGLWARIGSNYPTSQLHRLAAYDIHNDGLRQLPEPQEHRTFFAYDAQGNRDDTNPAYHFNRIGQPLPEALKGYVLSTPAQGSPHQFDPLAIQPDDWPDAYEGATVVHLSPLALATHLHIPKMLRARGIKQITLDPGERYMIPSREPYIRQVLPQIDVFLPSTMEIRSLFGEDKAMAEAAATLCQWGAPMVVIKNGANGVIVCEGSRLTYLPAYHQQGDGRVIDITGAGDSFCGGFMVGLAQTGDPFQAAKMGLIAASLVIEGYGAMYALSRRSEAQARLKERGWGSGY